MAVGGDVGSRGFVDGMRSCWYGTHVRSLGDFVAVRSSIEEAEMFM